MSAKSAVLSTVCGPIPAEILLIGEAPGRRGADRTGKPFEGDRSSDNLHRLLDAVGLDRECIFITNAVLCCPEVNGRNTPPTLTETKNCADYLERTIELVNPRVIATLGAVALRSICRLYALKLSLAESAGRVFTIDQRSLVPLYHPSSRVLHTRRNFTRQANDMGCVLRLARTAKTCRPTPSRRATRPGSG